MTSRSVMPALLLLLAALLLVPAASATPFVHGDCEGIEVDGEFTGYCKDYSCYCPPSNDCQFWYVHGVYVLWACWA